MAENSVHRLIVGPKARIAARSASRYRVFHCQQAAEKAVKGYLAFRDHPLEKTHDVEKLVDLAVSYELGFEDWRRAAEALTPYATAFRYPPVRETDQDEYERAQEAAAGLFAFVCSLLPKEALPADRGEGKR